jgi:hypothetical protein
MTFDPADTERGKHELEAESEAATGWFDELDPGTDWYDGDSLAFQIDGHDLVHVSDINRETGVATIRVFTSTHPDAPVLFEGTVNVKERKEQDDDE